ncbi:hypothetical protein CU097_015685 [Rhizopus azygosporus]|uniref:Uncharacterized protein n=1 Tax=Rhizopus azygosporus TaxID=86630 RepID=A0A367KGI0_RHIAZ|nr:hypothetical protein CU097_015685 [Rhizopus azygosporus]
MTNTRYARAHPRPSRDSFPREDSAGNSSLAIAEEEGAQKMPIKNSSSSSNSRNRFENEPARWESLYIQSAESMEKLILAKLDESDDSKYKEIDEKISRIRRIIVIIEERIAQSQKSWNSSRQTKSVKQQPAATNVSKPDVLMENILPFRVLDTASYNINYYDQDEALPEIDNNNVFKTVCDFLIGFEVIFAYFRVDIENDWYRYLRLAIYNGQDERSIN